MKILMVGRFFYPVVGGVEIHMMNLARELIKRGHSVTVFTSDRDFSGKRLSAPETETVSGIEVRRFGSKSHIMSAINNLKSPDYDVIHYHLFRSVFVALSVIAGKKAGIPMVLTPHCVYPSISFGMSVKKFFFDSILGRSVLRRVSRIISLTENDRQDIIDVGANPEKIDIVPNSIRFDDFSELRSGDLFKQQFVTDRFILYVGRVDWNKGLEYVIRAMPKLKELGLKFVVIGEDLGYKEKLNEIIKENNVENSVIFTGRVSNELLLSAYAACTLFILPSFYEGLPTVVLEAMAYRKPVIAARTGGTKYVIKHGYNGFLVEYGDPGDIYLKVKEALSSDIEMLGNNARKDVEENYAWEKSAEKVEKVYLKAAGGKY